MTAIPKPRGEAGSKGFKLIREMGLDNTEEHKKLYRAITVRGKKQVKQVSDCDHHLCDSLLQQTVHDSIIKRSVDLSLNFCRVDSDDLSAIFKWVSTKALLFVFCLLMDLL